MRSPIGYTENQKRTVKALGLHRMNQVVEKPDNRRGAWHDQYRVSHLVEVSE